MPNNNRIETTEDLTVKLKLEYPLTGGVNKEYNKKLCQTVAKAISDLKPMFLHEEGETEGCKVYVDDIDLPYRHRVSNVPTVPTVPTTPPDTVDTPKRLSFNVEKDAVSPMKKSTRWHSK